MPTAAARRPNAAVVQRLRNSALVAIIKAAGARQVSIISHFAPHNNRSNREVHHTVVHATVA
jgi:hypothetical protein